MVKVSNKGEIMNISIEIREADEQVVLDAFTARFPAVRTEPTDANPEGEIDREATFRRAVEEYIVGNARDYKIDEARQQAAKDANDIEIKVS
jgi:hypothetical protein